MAAKFGDPIDPHFEGDEPLYLRVSPRAYASGTKQALLSHAPFPRFSVNRGKYSEPIDVTLPDHEGWAVAAFLVADIPAPLSAPAQGTNPPVVFEFRPVHLPENGNYAHSEVQSFAANGEIAEPSKTVRTTFRELLRQRIQFVVPAA